MTVSVMDVAMVKMAVGVVSKDDCVSKNAVCILFGKVFLPTA